MQIVIRHQTLYRYAASGPRIALLLRLWPSRFKGQKPLAWTVAVNGSEVKPGPANSFGDAVAFHRCLTTADALEIVAAGVVETEDKAGVVAGLKPEPPPLVFLRETPLTAPDAAIAALAVEARGENLLARLHSLSELVRDRVAYRPGTTTSESTAAEALAQGRGVCQDHAHIFVSAARVMGVPARYVVGYFLADKAEDALHETHGWAEACIDGLGWVGFDPTNGLCPTDHYVRVCSGFDALDAAPVRGSVTGATPSGIDADVLIGEAEADVEAQMQQQQ